MPTWLIRMALNLPCRQEDKAEIEKSIPEIFSSETKRNLLILPILYANIAEFRKIDFPSIREWANITTKNEITPTGKSKSPENCTAAKCPLRESNFSSHDELHSDASTESLEFEYLNLNLSGGEGRKNSSGAFLNLVRSNILNHKTNYITDIYITDRFIFADAGEDGQTGGYDTLMEYLGVLNLSTNFTLHLPSWPAMSYTQQSRGDTLTTAQSILQRLVSEKYSGCTFKSLPQKPKFHDRLYITRDEKTKLFGVFGPSLNGLKSEDIALMGEIDAKVLTNLDKAVFSKK